jgi:hypothetical protein
MAKPDEVTILSVSSAPVIDAQGRVTQGTTYTYTVGTFGPFVLTVSAMDDTPDNVNARLAAKVANLRAVGAVL